VTQPIQLARVGQLGRDVRSFDDLATGRPIATYEPGGSSTKSA
jgi:hypothetical protein